MATPATGALIGTPASMSDSEAPQTEAIDDRAVRLENFRDDADDVRELLHVRHHAATPRRARLPWPISRRFGEPIMPVSPTENGGKL